VKLNTDIVFSCLDIPVKHSLSLFIYYFSTEEKNFFSDLFCSYKKQCSFENREISVSYRI
jgi:hypothetical protein